MVLVLWALLPTPFVGEAEAANPLLESLVAKLGDLAAQLADHDDALASEAESPCGADSTVSRGLLPAPVELRKAIPERREAPMTTEQRLERLERENRWMQG